MRALLCAGLLRVVLKQFGSWHLEELPVAELLYLSALVGPASLAERWLRSRPRLGWRTAGAVWLAALGAALLARPQSVYGGAVFAEGSLVAGGEALAFEFGRLAALAPGELGSLAGVRNADLWLASASGAAAVLFCATLAGPWARRTGKPALLLWVPLVPVGLILGTLSTLLFLAGREPAFLAFPVLVAQFVWADLLPMLLATLPTWFLGGFLAHPLCALLALRPNQPA